jgi:DNA-binding transcriptional MerR regulator
MGQAATVIPEKIYFKIGEVCDLVGVQAHVLRYWETEFPMLSPQKNRSGQRSYRRRDVEVALRIKELLYDEMFTIAGAKKKLQSEQRGDPGKAKPADTRERPDYLRPVESNQALFEDGSELCLDDETNPRAAVDILSTDGREALRSLSSQLFELREMLKTDQTAEAADHLRNV